MAINRIFDDAVDLQLDLFRTAASVEVEVLDILRTLERELLGKLAGNTITEWSRTRANQQLRETRTLIQEYYARAADVSTEAMAGIANVTATATAATLVVSESQITRLSDDFLRTLAGDSIIQGAVQSDWWSRQSADTVFRFNGAVRQGIAAGETNQQIIRRVIQFMDVSRANAAALVQTSTATVANDARMAMFEANADIIKRYRAVATLDTNTCTRCAPLDGLEWEKDGTAIGHNQPMPRYPLHFNCLTGDAVITSCGDVTGYSKRWFDGEVVVIQTAAGRKLTCTPNHPILTGRGWVAAGLLDVGGNIISDRLSHGRAGINGNHQDVPTTIHDVIESAFGSGKVRPVPMPVTARDFHGDGIGSDVAIVWAKSLLSGEFNTSRPEHVAKHDLGFGNFNRLGSLSGLRRLGESLRIGGLATNSIMRTASELFSLLWGGRCHSCGLLLSTVAGFDSGVSEGANHNHAANSHAFRNSRNPDASMIDTQSVNHIYRHDTASGINTSGVESTDNATDAYAKLAGDLLAGSAGNVASDQIISVERVDFHGYVYNLETEKGWYVANGIITHNCRCLLIPQVFDSPPSGQRASADGLISARTTFTEWLERQPAEKVEDVLGKGRADLFRSGKITLAQLTNGAGRPLTLDQLRTKYGA